MRVLTGQVAIRARDIIRQVAVEHEIDIITGKIVSDHVHLFIAYGEQRTSAATSATSSVTKAALC